MVLVRLHRVTCLLGTKTTIESGRPSNLLCSKTTSNHHTIILSSHHALVLNTYPPYAQNQPHPLKAPSAPNNVNNIFPTED